MPAPTTTLLDVPGFEARTITSRVTIRAADDGGETGTFEGIACPWDTEDSYGTMFAPQCFSRGESDFGADAYAYLWMHSPYDPVGTFTAEERDDGLWISGTWDPTTRGQDARAQARTGSAPELSVGFIAMTVDPDNTDRFMQVRLQEVSQVTRRYGSVPGAALKDARSKLPREGHLRSVAQVRREQDARAQLAALRMMSA